MNQAGATRAYTREQVWLPASEGLLDWGEDFHDLMLGDELRMKAFHAAVREAVQPGSVVLDLGTGTGILAQWALEAGAARVYGIDLNEAVLDTARRRIAAAGHADRFHPLAGLSFDLELPERVDLVISEIMGNLADNENFGAILADAGRRFLAEGGAMLPSRVESYLVPVSAPHAHAQIRDGAPHDAGGRERFAGLLRGRGAPSPFDLYYDAVLPLSGYLAAPRVARVYDFGQLSGEGDGNYRVPLVWTARRDDVLTGFKGYFTATLSPTVALDISADDIEGRTTSDSWKHCYLPVRDPVPVHRGDRVALLFSRTAPDPADGAFRQVYRWQGRVVSSTGTVTGRFDHSTG
ncbi:methyltransferase domain-containing protein [Streptomyces polygonati]|uniref:Methyltransferase domain-containing protein n=1 Tax=Streptomyces polygonati TaxID=1617087 RepID=A0ABV8HMN6_9ACTN